MLNMKKVYRFLGLVGDHQMTMDVSKDIFIDRLKAHVGRAMDIFSSGRTDYKGVVGQSRFYLRRERGLLTKTRHYCKAIGQFREEKNQLLIEIKINAPIVFFYSIFIIGILFALFGILMGILTLNLDKVTNGFSFLFSITLFSALMATIVYFVSTKSIQKMKYELENNFYSYIKSKNDL
jgi:hypothetical protein